MAASAAAENALKQFANSTSLSEVLNITNSLSAAAPGPKAVSYSRYKEGQAPADVIDKAFAQQTGASIIDVTNRAQCLDSISQDTNENLFNHLVDLVQDSR